MATIDDKTFIDKIIAANGDPLLYLSAEDVADIKAGGPPEPGVVKIVEYRNMAGRKAWGVMFEGERDLNRYDELPDAKVIFMRQRQRV